MSTAEPFMPSHEPTAAPDPRDRDIDTDVDQLDHAKAGAVDEDPDAEAAAARQRERAQHTPFRTPQSGSARSVSALSSEALEKELGES